MNNHTSPAEDRILDSCRAFGGDASDCADIADRLSEIIDDLRDDVDNLREEIIDLKKELASKT
jgi:hypothetical protein